MGALTLDETIIYYKAIADQKSTEAAIEYDRDNFDEAIMCEICASENRQLAEWLEKLQAYEKLFDKPHGRIIDESQITKVWVYETNIKVGNLVCPYTQIDHTDAPTILEARKG